MHPQEKGRENMQNKMMKKYFPVFVLPTLLAFTIGFIVPFIMGVYLSFCKFTTVTDAKFVGLQNYVKIFTEDGTFGHALWYTTVFTVDCSDPSQESAMIALSMISPSGGVSTIT